MKTRSLGMNGGMTNVKKKLAALSMLHKAKKAYYACDVIRFLVPYAARLKLLVFFAKYIVSKKTLKNLHWMNCVFISITTNRTM